MRLPTSTPKTTLVLVLALLQLLTLTSASGCDPAKTHTPGHYSPGTSHSITVGYQSRRYGFTVPPNYSPNTPYPLILDFHGKSGSSDGQYANTLYDKYDAGKQYLVAYPEGLDAAWQSAPYAPNPPHDDLAFVSALVAHIEDEYCVDAQRVYASGKSNGGGFVDYLACADAGDIFAAFATGSAALYSDLSRADCKKKRAIMSAHGGADCTICYAGGDECCGKTKEGPTPDVGQWVGWWGERDGCAVGDAGPEGSGDVKTMRYSCGGKTDVVVHYKIEGLDHCWPSNGSHGVTTDYKRSYCTDKSLDYTPKVLDFFSKWTVDSAPKN